jgi:hypothetical protein
MISYCTVVYRTWYAKLLILDLIRKTNVRYEILLWLNVHDTEFDAFLAGLIAQRHPIRILGKTPENIGMQAFPTLFGAAKYAMITQMDDDVVMVSPRIAQICKDTFEQFPHVKQLVADTWQDKFTHGARPKMDKYRLIDKIYGLYRGPIDGWFSVYHRSIMPRLIQPVREKYFYIGSAIFEELEAGGMAGYLCTRFKVFHVTEPPYVAYYGALDFEIAKYRTVGQALLVKHYEDWRNKIPPRDLLESSIKTIKTALANAPDEESSHKYTRLRNRLKRNLRRVSRILRNKEPDFAPAIPGLTEMGSGVSSK